MKKQIKVVALAVLIAISATAGFAQKSTGGPSVIRDADNPARQPVQFQFDHLLNTDTAFISLPPVPTAKCLVIENVSIEAYVPHGSGERPFVRLRTTAGGATYAHPFPLSFVFHWGWDTWAAIHKVRLYCDPGQPIVATVMRSPDTNGGFTGSARFFITISGYYVDVP